MVCKFSLAPWPPSVSHLRILSLQESGQIDCLLESQHEYGRRQLVVDCFNTKLPKSLNVVLHGLERFGGVPLPIHDLARDP